VRLWQKLLLSSSFLGSHRFSCPKTRSCISWPSLILSKALISIPMMVAGMLAIIKNRVLSSRFSLLLLLVLSLRPFCPRLFLYPYPLCSGYVFLVGCWRGDLRKLRRHGTVLISNKSGDGDSKTLDDGKEDTSEGSRGQGDLGAATGSQDSARQESRSNRVPGILLLTDTLHSTVKGREETSPDGKVSSQNWSASLQRCQSSGEAFAPWRVLGTLDTVPDTSTDSAHSE
jgi:hypothetical protein